MAINRRNFLRLTGAGIAGGVMLGGAGCSVNKGGKSKKIIYRTLGKTGIKVPVVSLGVMRVDNVNLILSAYNAGMRHFDTAYSYQNGKSEEILGQALKDKKRDSFVIATKINTRDTTDIVKDFPVKLDKSLERLQMDYVDILYYHGANKPDIVKDEQIIKVFQEFKASGKVKSIGISVHSNIPEVIKAATEVKVWDVILTSYNFKMENFTEVKNAIAEAAKAGIGIVAMKTMAGVYWDKEKTKKINTKAALKWALSDENVTTAIPGCTSFDQLEENIGVLTSVALTDQEKEDLDIGKHTAGLVCVGCNECIPQCPKNVPVPDLMRAYMYTYGYDAPKLAYEVVSEVPENACTLCPECKVECRMGFDVRERAMDVMRLHSVPKEFLV